MKKSTGVILGLTIILLLGVIGVGGVFFAKENNDSSKEIAELKNEVAGLSKNAENTTNQSSKNTESNTNSSSNTSITKTYSDIKGTYESQKINMNEGNNEEP